MKSLKHHLSVSLISILPPRNSSLKVAWAGRFDEQKRPDLLIEIAKLMPETEFHVWGKAVLSKENYDFSSCQNIKLHGLYGSIDEVLHQGCNVYLYTSGWDGIPTILLDMVDLGLPIVASNVGGVSEALPEWSLVDGNGNAQAYVDKMMSISNNISDYCVDMLNHKKSLMNECTTEIYNTKIGKR
ncbi:glycosyltransferase [Vibrio sp. CDRSL-10 TSBA]